MIMNTAKNTSLNKLTFFIFYPFIKMLPCMLRSNSEFKILKPVVRLVSINMMHIFASMKLPIKILLHNITMFKNRSIISPNRLVTSLCNVTRTFFCDLIRSISISVFVKSLLVKRTKFTSFGYDCTSISRAYYLRIRLYLLQRIAMPRAAFLNWSSRYKRLVAESTVNHFRRMWHGTFNNNIFKHCCQGA